MASTNRSQLDATHLQRCIATLEYALSELARLKPDDISHDLARAACVKEFEIILEQSGKMLRHRLGDYFAESQQAQRLTFNDVFRQAGKHGLLDAKAAERWLHYREKRNTTAHEYGKNFAEDVIKLLPDFVEDAKSLVQAIGSTGND